MTYKGPMDASIDKLVDLLVDSRKTVVLTGAGVSTESGIPDYRGPNGLWRKYDTVKYVSVRTFEEDPTLFWEFNLPRWMEYRSAKPNSAHYLLASMESYGVLACVITQNIDGLHRKAGSKRVYEVHGSVEKVYCLKCKRTYTMEEAYEQFKQGKLPTCQCGGLLRPEVVLFGDPMPEVFCEAVEEVRTCDLMIVLGSSLQVYPVAELPYMVPNLAIINLEPTPYDWKSDVVLHMTTGEFARLLSQRLGLELNAHEEVSK